MIRRNVLKIYQDWLLLWVIQQCKMKTFWDCRSPTQLPFCGTIDDVFEFCWLKKKYPIERSRPLLHPESPHHSRLDVFLRFTRFLSEGQGDSEALHYG